MISVQGFACLVILRERYSALAARFEFENLSILLYKRDNSIRYRDKLKIRLSTLAILQNLSKNLYDEVV
jgi:hypothetical protein